MSPLYIVSASLKNYLNVCVSSNRIIQKAIFTFQSEAVNRLLGCITFTVHYSFSSLGNINKKTVLRQRLLLLFTFVHSVARNMEVLSLKISQMEKSLLILQVYKKGSGRSSIFLLKLLALFFESACR